ncbi:hypothetical protein NQ117_13450 [Paenibacillus sp. SC116]|uniref:hypothetical protein n=1 Tax=Paenibacillus sp. SC116 TaxID=2968986 RepID=UPI00215AC3A0|nr:hypothetical protein [Paenibacillus sp. SC116]MCR8844690.1 hypothetical protein [Paenibacillus sp. SC116]
MLNSAHPYGRDRFIYRGLFILLVVAGIALTGCSAKQELLVPTFVTLPQWGHIPIPEKVKEDESTDDRLNYLITYEYKAFVDYYLKELQALDWSLEEFEANKLFHASKGDDDFVIIMTKTDKKDVVRLTIKRKEVTGR